MPDPIPRMGTACVCGSRGGHPEPPSHPKEQPKATTTAGGAPRVPSSATPARPAPPCALQEPRGALGHPHNPSLPYSTLQAPLTTTPNLPNPLNTHIPIPSFPQHRDHPRCNPAPGEVWKTLREYPPNARAPPQPLPSPGRQRERGELPGAAGACGERRGGGARRPAIAARHPRSARMLGTARGAMLSAIRPPPPAKRNINKFLKPPTAYLGLARSSGSNPALET